MWPIQTKHDAIAVSIKVLSQRIIPLLLDHQDLIRYQGLAVRAFRNMMAQKVQLPLQFPGTHDYQNRNEHPLPRQSFSSPHKTDTPYTL